MENIIAYDPNRSQISSNTLAIFIQSPVTGNILEVPGIGPKIAKILSNNNINTTFQLFSLFLSLKDENVESIELCDKFFYTLKEYGISQVNISSIIEAVAQKLDVYFPGIYDNNMF